MRWACRKDASHNRITNALEVIGVQVLDTSRYPEFCDAVLFHHGKTYLVEIKDGSKPPSARRLTYAQERLREKARLGGVTIQLFESVDQALAFFGARVSLTGPERFAERAA